MRFQGFFEVASSVCLMLGLLSCGGGKPNVKDMTPKPVIASFTAIPEFPCKGETVQLLAKFDIGSASVYVGNETAPVYTLEKDKPFEAANHPITEPMTFRLVVKNGGPEATVETKLVVGFREKPETPVIKLDFDASLGVEKGQLCRASVGDVPAGYGYQWDVVQATIEGVKTNKDFAFRPDGTGDVILKCSIISKSQVVSEACELPISLKESLGRILSFKIDGVSGVIDEKAKTIFVALPPGKDLTKLKPVIEITSGAAVLPASEEEKDFTNAPVPYIVKAKSGKERVYQVTVKAVEPSKPVIMSLSAEPSKISSGDVTRLTAVFQNGEGVIEGIGSVKSGVAVEQKPSVTTTYTLTVPGAEPPTRQVTVTVVPLPGVPVIKAPGGVSAGKAFEASVAPETGCKYSWQAVNATPATAVGDKVAFTPDGKGTVKLNCVASNEMGKASAPGVLEIQLAKTVIESFKADPSKISAGDSTLLTAIFQNGEGSIEGIGVVKSGVAIEQKPKATTTYTLTVPGAEPPTRQVIVTVVPLPAIPSIKAPASLVGNKSFEASVDEVAGCKYKWQATNATPATAEGAKAAFTPDGKGPVKLSCVTSNELGKTSAPGVLQIPLSSEKTITSFIIDGCVGVIDEVSHTISVKVPPRDLNDLKPTVALSMGATVNPASGQTVDFSSGSKIYKVTAADGTVQEYVVKVALPGKFEVVGKLITAREWPTVTCLENGKVLIVGGVGQTHNKLSSAEIWDPETRTSTLTGSMPEGRMRHLATLLANGQVLIVGGTTPNGMAETCLLYDPKTGLFTPTGSLNRKPADPEGLSLITMPDGRVLFLDGLEKAQVYNPLLQKWNYTEPFCVNRFNNMGAATLLGNGKVLVVGGADFNGLLNKAELYDPSNNAFTFTGDLDKYYERCTATQLGDGRVLVVGHCKGDKTCSASIYNPYLGTFTSLSVPSNLFSSGYDTYKSILLKNGLVALLGFGSDCRLCALFDIAKQKFYIIGSTITYYGKIVFLPKTGEAIKAGGYMDNSALVCVEMIDFEYNLLSKVAAPFGNLLHASNTPFASASHLVIGGEINGIPQSNVALVDNANQTTTSIASMHISRSGHTATMLTEGKLLVIGGDVMGTAELFDTRTQQFTLLGARLNMPRRGHRATLQPDGQVLIEGGVGSDGKVVEVSERYNPAKDRFDLVP